MIVRDGSLAAFRCGASIQMSMTPARFPVSVIIECRPLASRWQSERWEPVAVEPAAGEPAAGEPAAGEPAAGDGMTAATAPTAIDARQTRWRFDGYAIELHRSEAEGYFLNTTSPEPKVFVMWRRCDDSARPPIRPEVVTVSYNEAARLMDGGEYVDAVPMLEEIRAWMAPFVAEHYKPEPRRKVRRNDPFADNDGHSERRRQR